MEPGGRLLSQGGYPAVELVFAVALRRSDVPENDALRLILTRCAKPCPFGTTGVQHQDRLQRAVEAPPQPPPFDMGHAGHKGPALPHTVRAWVASARRQDRASAVHSEWREPNTFLEAPMSSSKSVVNASRQVELPAEVAEHLAVGPGDEVVFEVLEGGRVLLGRRRVHIMDLAGAVKGRGSLSLDDIEAAIAAGAAGA